jgi:prepilin-type N-terminal cleavage/methylation domain-containing protein
MSPRTSHTILASGSLARLRAQRGFSLFETLMAMLIASILVVVAVPKIGDFWTQYRLAGASNELAFEIALARMQGIAQNRYARVRISSTTQYVRETSSDNTTWTAQATTPLPAGLTASSGEVRFDKRGYATVTNSITLTNTLSKTKTLATNILGRVTIT